MAVSPDVQGSWGAYVQGGENLQRLDLMGSELSVRLDCPVHYPAFNKRLFECKCGKTFPVFMVDAAMQTEDWSQVEHIHENGRT